MFLNYVRAAILEWVGARPGRITAHPNMLKVSENVTPRTAVTEVEKKSHSFETGQIGGTLDSPRSEIVR
jgi:hypothetical protein